MVKNGKASCIVNSGRINIRHFFVKDRFYKGEIEVRYCPTHLIIYDYFTKPLQGEMFKMFCDFIMGYTHINYILHEIKFSVKEFV